MKLMYGNVPVKSMNIHSYELNTNDATLKASDMQAGVTAYAKGQKITGTGKCFEFASYGNFQTNMADYMPVLINVIEIASIDYPIKSVFSLYETKDVDFSIEQNVGIVTIDNVEYPIAIKIENSLMTLKCEKEITLEVFCGKDNYR
jgi:hypothetical protein